MTTFPHCRKGNDLDRRLAPTILSTLGSDPKSAGASIHIHHCSVRPAGLRFSQHHDQAAHTKAPLGVPFFVNEPGTRGIWHGRNTGKETSYVAFCSPYHQICQQEDWTDSGVDDIGKFVSTIVPAARRGVLRQYRSTPPALESRFRREEGTDWDTFCSSIEALPSGLLWRHNQAGDLPGSFGIIHSRRLDQLVRANTAKRGFTFTHYRLTQSNLGAIWSANQGGFCINLSADRLSEADRLAHLQIAPVVSLVPGNTAGPVFTPARRKVVLCPAQVTDGVTCMTCRLCAKVDRGVIVGFLPHGRQAKAAEIVASGVKQRFRGSEHLSA